MSATFERTYRVVFFANLTTAVGMLSFLPFFPSYLEMLGLTDREEITLWSGLAFGAAPLTAAIMGPIWGSIGDRFGRKVMVVRALLAITVFVGLMGFVRAPWQLLALRIGQGVFSGFVPPSITLVSIAAPREAQGRVAGSLQSALAAGSVLGPLAGAALQHAFGLRSVFWFVSGAAALSALAVAVFAHEDPALRATLDGWSPGRLARGAGRDLKSVFANSRLRAAVLMLFCVQFGVGASNPLLELYVRDLVTGDTAHVPALTAALFTCLAVAQLVATPLWGRYGDHIGHRPALVRAAALSGLVLLGHAAVLGYGALLAARMLLGATAAGPNTTAFGVAAHETPAERRGSAFGVVFSARAFAVSLGAICGGALASIVGIRGLFVLAGGLVLLALFLGSRRGVPDGATVKRP